MSPPDSLPDEHFGDLAAYALGAMPADEIPSFERQLADCETCQAELVELRGSVADLDAAPELALDGPPEGAEFMIRRALAGVRAELAADELITTTDSGRREPASRGPSPAGRWGRQLLVAAAAGIVLLLVGGVLGGAIGRSSAPEPVAIPTPGASSTAAPTDPAGTRSVTAVSTRTGARLAAKIVPAAGWVRLTVDASGIAQGRRCHLVVVAKDGTRVEAGSWQVSEAGASAGTKLQGAALVAPADVAAVQVQDDTGQVLVRAGV